MTRRIPPTTPTRRGDAVTRRHPLIPLLRLAVSAAMIVGVWVVAVKAVYTPWALVLGIAGVVFGVWLVITEGKP